MREQPWVSVIDDDASLRAALVLLLRSSGIHARGFASAEDFLGRADGLDPTCVLLDVHLGTGLTGYELKERLESEGRPLPIIFMTAHSELPSGWATVMREQLSPGVEIYDEYLDLGRFSGPDRSAQLARYFAEKYQRVRPDAIVAEGTPALRFVIDRLRGLFPEIPVVYGGAFEPALDFSSLPDNVVGRRQLLPFASTYSLAHALQPRAERFLLVGGASLGDSVLIVEAQRQITPLLTGTQMQVYQDWSYEGLIDSLRHLPLARSCCCRTSRGTRTDESSSPGTWSRVWHVWRRYPCTGSRATGSVMESLVAA